MAEAFVKTTQNVREGDLNELEIYLEELFMQGISKELGKQLSEGGL